MASYNQFTFLELSPHVIPIAFLQMYNAVIALVVRSQILGFIFKMIPRYFTLLAKASSDPFNEGGLN